MKLNIVPAKQGVQWFKLGVRTFFKQPLALSGLFFMFMALMSELTLVPVLGNVLALALLPGATLGLMAATEETTKGKFPMPTVLLSAFRAGRQQARSMLILGLIYAAGFLLVLGISATVDGGKFAHLYLMGGAMTPETVMEPDFEMAVLLAMGWLIGRTRLGLFVRGVTQNRSIASCMGVNTARIDTYAFALGSGIAGLAGCALSQVGNVGPDLGQGYIVDSFMVVVLGGVGQLAGTVYAALGLGLLNKLLEGLAGAVLAKIAVLVFIIVFIQKRPQGIFAMKGRSAEA